jgi:hypothetical protein
MSDRDQVQTLTGALQLYFDLMYDADLSRFDRVFRSTAQLHGFRDGAMTVFSAASYKELLGSRPSPKALNAPRHDEILMVDCASSTQALAKVRVRINTVVFVDYLTYHLIDGAWLITSKGFHVERTLPAAALAV